MFLAEWYNEQRIHDARAYKFVMTQFTDAPKAGDIFPLLKDSKQEASRNQADDPDKDDSIFHMVSASFSSSLSK